MSYLDASREIAHRGQVVDQQRGTGVNQPSKKRSGLGRGLASLIPPTGPADEDPLGSKLGERGRRCAHGWPPAAGPAAPAAGGPAAVSEFGAVYREIDPKLIDRTPPPAPPAGVRRGSTRRDGALHQRVRRHAADRGAGVSGTGDGGARYQLVMGGSGGGAPRRRPGCPPSRRSSARPLMAICCVTRFWRTSTGPS